MEKVCLVFALLYFITGTFFVYMATHKTDSRRPSDFEFFSGEIYYITAPSGFEIYPLGEDRQRAIVRKK